MRAQFRSVLLLFALWACGDTVTPDMRPSVQSQVSSGIVLMLWEEPDPSAEARFWDVFRITSPFTGTTFVNPCGLDLLAGQWFVQRASGVTRDHLLRFHGRVAFQAPFPPGTDLGGSITTGGAPLCTLDGTQWGAAYVYLPE